MKAQRGALGWLAAIAGLVIAWLALPFAISLLLGMLMAFTLAPVYKSLLRRSGRPRFAAATTVMASGAAVVAAAASFVTLFVVRMVDFASTVHHGLEPGGALAARAESLTRWAARYGVTANIPSRLDAGAGEIASWSATMAGLVASGTFSAILGLFFALLTMYVVLRHWPRMAEAIVVVSPLSDEHTRAVLDEFQRAGRATLAGTVVTGLAQGILAGVGFWISGLPQPAFFGAATAVASLMPGIGTLLIWVPAGVYLAVTGHIPGAILELGWCMLMVVGLSDYVIRPKLVGKEGTPAILVFIALFGGLEVLGLSGLIMGPILMALAVATLRLYMREERRADGRT